MSVYGSVFVNSICVLRSMTLVIRELCRRIQVIHCTLRQIALNCC